jgi:anthranilate synthase component 2/putative glutamine amidotransferase
MTAGPRPLVGLTTYDTEATWGPWHEPAAVLPAPYFELTAAAGARPLLLPPCRDDGAGGRGGADQVVAALDALVLVGGGDVDPAAYGAHPDRNDDGVDPTRDGAETALLEAALAADLPVLAICRGLQLLNVALGGTLVRHLPAVAGGSWHRPAPGTFGEVVVRTVPGTRTAAVWGPDTTVRCSHHQSVDRLGHGLTVTARSVEPTGSALSDGVVEAVEMEGRRFVLGVQWHPEASADRRPFDALVAATR